MFSFNNKKTMYQIIVVFFVFGAILSGCAGFKNFTFQEDLPTIAHVHIGHAVTGWMHAPEKKGLFITAEEEGQIALTEAKKALEKPEDIATIKQHISGTLHALDSESVEKGPGLGFGLMKALEEASGHITYAARSDDASINVQQFADKFEENTLPALERSELVLALGQEILTLQSADDAHILAAEIHCNVEAIVNGSDAAEECRAAVSADDFGLKQLRAQLEEMIAREVPEYKTVATRYLFGVIKLPSGKWAFSWLVDPFFDDEEDDEEGGDGGGGGY